MGKIANFDDQFNIMTTCFTVQSLFNAKYEQCRYFFFIQIVNVGIICLK